MHPYRSLEDKAFWSTAVAKRDMLKIDELWDPLFRIRKKDRIVTFGSCFAQHFARALTKHGYTWLCTEPAPTGLSKENAAKFNYGVFSSRVGNIYTASLFNQWTSWALGLREVPDECWEKDGRFFDPFRPNVEPGGFASKQEMLASRQMTIEAFGAAIKQANIFVFTLGLTESWFNRKLGYEYPMCPGTVAGEFDEEKHEFRNQDYTYILEKLQITLRLIQKAKPKIRFILTVSPVPLTATNSGEHVLVASSGSKAILRAVAGHLSTKMKRVEYFPSYEIISGTPYQGVFFDENQRTVRQEGVDHVMANFFACQNAKFGDSKNKSMAGRKIENDKGVEDEHVKQKQDQDIVCEEEILDAFSR